MGVAQFIDGTTFALTCAECGNTVTEAGIVAAEYPTVRHRLV